MSYIPKIILVKKDLDGYISKTEYNPNVMNPISDNDKAIRFIVDKYNDIDSTCEINIKDVNRNYITILLIETEFSTINKLIRNELDKNQINYSLIK